MTKEDRISFFDILKVSMEELTNSVHFVHIRILQRNARKTVTTIEGLPEKIDHERVLKALKKRFNCNGCIQGTVLLLQGDHRVEARSWLIEENISHSRNITIHGY